MLKSRKVQREIAENPAPRRRLRRLASRVARYKRLFAASSTLVVVLSVLLLGFVMTEGPDRVVLGVGKAGVMDTLAADTAATDTLAAETAEAETGAPADEPAVPDVASTLPEGPASYYGNELAGRPTASGERFDPGRLTAAHRTLPFGTRLRVTNLRNGQSVVVRVNDRGPFSGNRVLDLSQEAARQIGMLRQGTARVRMEVLK